MERKKQKSNKKRAILPFVGQFIHAITVYVLIPILAFVVMVAALMDFPKSQPILHNQELQNGVLLAEFCTS